MSRAVGRGLLALLGWHVDGNLPDLRKAVVIVAPHTSNWDFVLGIAAKLAFGLHASWLGKDSLFRGPFAWFMRRMGGIPVDRSRPQDVVSQSVARFAASERMVLGLSPEGTRKAVARWRSGFYHIARGAGVPIVPVALDWPSRSLVVGPPVQTSADMEADMAALGAFYAPWRGRRGESTPPPL
jgi:1-acyl-sn-glycerol-3-phosphate acyltransferase